MTLSKRLLLGIVILAVSIYSLAKGLTVRKVQWEGDAPVSIRSVVNVNDALLGRPIWSVTVRQIFHYLKSELVGELKVYRKLPGTIIIIANAPNLLGVIPEGGRGVLVDEKGKRWGKVPLWATKLPFILLSDGLSVSKCAKAVSKTRDLCLKKGIPVKAVWVNRFGEVTICLPGGQWLRLGNPIVLETKLQLTIALKRDGWLKNNIVADLTLPNKISFWKLPSQKPKRQKFSEGK